MLAYNAHCMSLRFFYYSLDIYFTAEFHHRLMQILASSIARHRINFSGLNNIVWDFGIATAKEIRTLLIAQSLDVGAGVFKLL